MKVSRDGLADFAKRVVSELPKVAGIRAHVVGLTGPLGAGKTTFVQSVAYALGVQETVPSPTFVLMHSYPIRHGPFKRLIHIDAYRLSSAEKDTVGWRVYLNDPENFVLIEWPENLPGGMPEGAKSLEFRVKSEHIREVIET